MMRKWQILVVISVVFIMVLGLGWAPDASAKKYKWRLPQVMPEDSDQHRRAAAFANEVKVKTEGRIDITVYSGGTLCDWVECHERVMRGDYELALQPLAPTYDPRLNIGYYMPYLFTNTKEAKNAYKRGGWVYNMVDDLLVDQGIKGLALFPMGWAGMTTRKEPDGWREMMPNKMKIRVMPLKACELTYERLGFIPSTIPYNEAFSAIERGVADGEMGGPPFQGYQFRDIQGVWIQYNDYLEPWWFFMNLKLFNKLDKKDQKILMDAAEKQVKGRWDYFLEEDEQYRQKLKEFGLQVLMPTDKELKAFAKAIREDVWPKMEPLMGKALVDRCRKEVGMEVK
jgi:TRAP-type C4-dicarboxylate transport system substrate-binding protein